jgi:hypothetical protein
VDRETRDEYDEEQGSDDEEDSEHRIDSLHSPLDHSFVIPLLI